MRDTFVRTLIALAKQDKQIELVTGDLGFGVLKPFWEQCPDQFTNAGIAEQNMVALSAGMAMEGKNVFVYSIGNFPTLRCLEQIRNDCAYHNASVKIVCVGGGFVYGNLGMTHHATEDLGCLRVIPNVVVMAPADKVEAEACTKALAAYHGTAYLRLGRGGEQIIHSSPIDEFRIGKALKIHDGDRVAILSTGTIFDEVTLARELLIAKGIRPAVYSFPTVKPIDRELIEEISKGFDIIATCEEHQASGGFGSAVAEVLAEAKHPKARLIRFALRDEFPSKVGSQKYLRALCGIDGNTIAAKIINEL